MFLFLSVLAAGVALLSIAAGLDRLFGLDRRFSDPVTGFYAARRRSAAVWAFEGRARR